LRIHS